jgi:hypothetical protein
MFVKILKKENILIGIVMFQQKHHNHISVYGSPVMGMCTLQKLFPLFFSDKASDFHCQSFIWKRFSPCHSLLTFSLLFSFFFSRSISAFLDHIMLGLHFHLIFFLDLYLSQILLFLAFISSIVSPKPQIIRCQSSQLAQFLSVVQFLYFRNHNSPYWPIIALGSKSSTQKHPEAFYTNVINGKVEIKRSWFQLGTMKKWQRFSTSYWNHQIFPLKESTHSHLIRLHVSIIVHWISSII